MEENKDVPIEKKEDGQPAEEFEIENAEVNTFDPIPLGTISNEKSDRSSVAFYYLKSYNSGAISLIKLLINLINTPTSQSSAVISLHSSSVERKSFLDSITAEHP